MESIKTWARGVFILSVLSSTALLLVPKNSVKQARFVLSMLLLLCTIAPLVRLVPNIEETTASEVISQGMTDQFSLARFLEQETEDMVKAVASEAGLKILSVHVDTDGFSLHSVRIEMEGPIPEETLEAFRDSLSAYLGVGEESLWLSLI
jgi:hypothetical protein